MCSNARSADPDRQTTRAFTGTRRPPLPCSRNTLRAVHPRQHMIRREKISVRRDRRGGTAIRIARGMGNGKPAVHPAAQVVAVRHHHGAHPLGDHPACRRHRAPWDPAAVRPHTPERTTPQAELPTTRTNLIHPGGTKHRHAGFVTSDFKNPPTIVPPPAGTERPSPAPATRPGRSTTSPGRGMKRRHRAGCRHAPAGSPGSG